MSHTSGTGDGFGFPGYAPHGAAPVDPADPRRRPAALESPRRASGARTDDRLRVFGWRGDDSAARLDGRRRQAVREIAREWVLDPIGMTNSTFEQPLPPAVARNRRRARTIARARAWATRGTSIRSRRRRACGRRRPIWRSSRSKCSWRCSGKSNRVLSQTTAREMVTPVGVGPFAVGFQIAKEGEGWYFMHGGSNWGFQCDLMAHRVQGLRRGDHDQQRQRRCADSAAAPADPAGAQVGCAGPADPAALRTWIGTGRIHA